MNTPPELKTVLQAPYAYNWPKADNVRIASRIGIPYSTFQTIAPASDAPDNGVGQITFNQPLGNLTGGAPRLRIKFTAEINTMADLNNKIGLKSNPVNRSLPVAVINMNGKTFTSYPAQLIKLHQYNADPLELALLSPCSDVDEYTKIENDSLNNPYRTGIDSPDSRMSRGLGCNYLYHIQPKKDGDTTTKIDFVVDEALVANPTQYKNIKDPVPFRNLNTFKVILDGQFKPENLIGISNDVPLPDDDDFEVTISGFKIEMLVQNWVAPLEIGDIPKTIIYNTPLISLEGNKTKTCINDRAPYKKQEERTQHFIETHSMAMNNVPSMFAVMVSQDGQPYKFYPDQLAGITKLEIKVDSDVGIFRELSQEQLYELSSANGYNKRFSCFSGALANGCQVHAAADDAAKIKKAIFGAGSVIFFRPSDLGLKDYHVLANANKSINMQVKATFVTPNDVGSPASYKLEVFSIRDNLTYSFEDGTFMDDLTLYTPDQLLKSPLKLTDDNNKLMRVMGGSFMGDVMTNFNHMAAHPVTKTVTKLLRNAGPLKDYAGDGTMMGNIASVYGYGKKKTTTRKKKGGEIVLLGSGKKGGKKLSDKQLHDLRNL
nr:MCP [Cafeteriavirus-dependent mavirus]CAI9421423.1 MCP [Cafeteriavirus-dependent mavirus]